VVKIWGSGEMGSGEWGVWEREKGGRKRKGEERGIRKREEVVLYELDLGVVQHHDES